MFRRGVTCKRFPLTTLFEKKIEWFLVFVFTYGRGTVTRREHVFSQVEPFLRTLFCVRFFDELLDVWVHLEI
jgi:hypothetical protein